MQHFYLREFPRGTDSEIEAILAKLPQYTHDLNEINRSITLTRKLREIALRENNESVANALLEVEKLGVFNQFLSICLLDLFVIYKNTLSAVHLWDELYCLRQGYLLIFESLKTYNAHSNALKELSVKTSTEAESLFSSLVKEIKKFKSESQYKDLISEFRNNTIGHIEKDPVSFFNKMSKLNTDQAFNTLKAFPLLLARMLDLSELIFKTYTKEIIKEVSFDLLFIRENGIEINELLEAIAHRSDNINTK